MNLSKSNYCQLWQCPKMAWLFKFRPELGASVAGLQSKLEAGNRIGDLAMGLFGDFTELTTYNEEGRLDLATMMDKTKAELAKGTEVICEATFAYNGLNCAVDILRKDGDGYAIYEVKSSTTSEEKKDIKPIYVADISYQKYVLEHCGINVSGTYLVTLNGDYVMADKLDVYKLFNITDVSALVAEEIKNVEKMISVGEQVLSCEEEPNVPLSESCQKPYDCPYQAYCMRNIPKPSVFDVQGMRFKTMLKLYNEGIVTFQQLLESGKVKSENQLRQIDFWINNRGTHKDADKIKEFLGTLSYPIYFLDFETMQLPVPEFPGTKPYQQIAFQYSLHYIEKPDGELKHKEFLATSGEDPRRAIAEALCRDIPMNVCVTAYNKGFECGRIKELAATFPDLAEHLLNIRSNIKDLMTPFQSGYYYTKAMNGSYSIKSVLPALYPDDPALDYHNLEGVHNGGEAMELFPRIKDMPKEEQEKAIHNLLKYCELDTYAMVKVWESLLAC